MNIEIDHPYPIADLQNTPLLLPMNPPERGLAVRSTEREVHGHYAVPMELDASHEADRRRPRPQHKK
jgi:hypothetical protein